MPSEEARSPGRRSNVENAPRRRPITGVPATPTSHIWHAILRMPPVTRQSAASRARRPCPAARSHYVIISRDGRKLVTRVRVMLPYHAPIANPPNSAQLGLGAASTMPPSYIRVRAVVWAYGLGQTDTQTRVTTIHFASSTTHAKCNYLDSRGLPQFECGRRKTDFSLSASFVHS